MNIKKNTFKNIIALTLSLIVLVSGAVFGGCSKKKTTGSYTVAFSHPVITLVEGDTLTVTNESFTFTGTPPSNFDFSLSTSDTKIIGIDDEAKTVTGLQEGKATLTATEKSTSAKTSCTIKITRSPQSMTLTLEADTRSSTLTQNTSETNVYALVDNGKTSVTDYEFTWTVDGSTIPFKGSVLTLAPPSAPKTKKLKATVTIGGKELTAETSVNWATPFTSPITLNKTSGFTVQTAGATVPVTYLLSYDKGSNTEPVIDWFVDGKLVARDSDTYSFTPQNLGDNTVTATVNGVEATASDNVVSVNGTKVPTNVTVDYDTLYPAVLVKFDEGRPNERFEVKSVCVANSESKTYEIAENICVIPSSDIDLFSSDYQFSVRSLGDGKMMKPSEFSKVVEQKKLPQEAKNYIEKTWIDGNYYITSDEEFYKIYDYFMLYRSRPLLYEDKIGAKEPSYDTNSEKYTDTHKIYLGYTPSVSLSTLVGDAFNKANYTGSYDMSSTQSGKEVTLKCTYSTSSSPSKTHNKTTLKQEALNGVVPHTSETGRESDTLPIDSVTKTAQVSTTDQLYRVAEMGYRPVITDETSRASQYYSYARTLLKTIIDDSMSDIEKAHAIYDWIMWRVYYDNTVTTVSAIPEAVTFGAFYIEGVLTDKNYLAVCDGMSKAFSLLCNMEGLPCIRVAGTADSGSGQGGHAWNKVMVDGKWYIVDCTWGDLAVTIDEKQTELATHMYFLKTDWEMPTHIESEDNDYPATTPIPYEYYKQTFIASGVNAYISSDSEIEALATAVLANAQAELADGKVEYTYGATTTNSAYYMVEVKVADYSAGSKVILSSASQEYNPVVKKIMNAGMKIKVIAKDDNDCVFFIISK